MSLPVTVIGIGEDGLNGLSAHARALLDQATMICGGARHLEMLGDNDARPQRAWGTNLAADIERIGAAAVDENVCVLASGDPLNYGVAVKMIKILGPDAVRVVPHPGAFSLACGRMGWAVSDPMLRAVSVHSRPLAALKRDIQPNIKLVILSRDGKSPGEISAVLNAMGYGQSHMTVLERIGGAAEAHSTARACEGFDGAFDNLNTVCVDCIADTDCMPLSRVPGLPDGAYQHDGTITKRDVRAVTLAALGPLPGDVLWDIGAGSGTVAIEWLRCEPSARAVAFEHDADRIENIRANAEALGVPELTVAEGVFPKSMSDDLRAPDAVFVGGGIARDSDILVAAFDALKPGGRLVANAVTLEAQAHLLTAMRVMGGELVRIGIAQAAPVGEMTALKPAIDVLQWRMVKP